jgi:integrase
VTIYFDNTNHVWILKLKSADGKWRPKRLAMDDPSNVVPGIIPDHIRAMAAAIQGQDTDLPAERPHMTASTPQDQTRRINLYDRMEVFYRQQEKTLCPLSLRKLRYVIDSFGKWCRKQGISSLDEVRAGTVQDYVDSTSAHRKPQTTRNQLSMLGKMWSKAIRLEQYQGQNPIRAVCHDLPSSNTDARPECLTRDEIDALLALIAERKARPFDRGPNSRLPQWFEDIIVFQLNTGMRVSAAIALRFDWIAGNKITIPAEWSKSRRSYVAVANDKVQAIIARRRAELGRDAARVFPEVKASQWLYSRLNYLAKALVKSGKWKRDVGHYNHVLRHTFITEALRAGVPLVMVSKLAGHTSVAMTQRYDQTTGDDAIRWAIDKGVSF